VPKTLLIRADASPEIGTGHVMRCLALAQAWQETGGKVLFAFALATPNIENRVKAEGFESVRINATAGSEEDGRQTIALARARQAGCVVLDGYHFGAAYQQSLKAAGPRVLFFDDYGHAEHYHADFVLNQNLSADAQLYTRRDPSTQLLLGPRYAQLRREFWKWRDWSRTIPETGRRILVTFGGSDPVGATSMALDALPQLKLAGLESVVAIGGSNPRASELEVKASRLAGSIRVERDSCRMAELMAWADIAVAAGGSTNWELAFMGLPTLVLVLAENQRDIAAQLDRAGLVRRLGDHDKVQASQISGALREMLTDQPGRKTMSALGRTLVDGLGSRRVVAALQG
jgi:UDP-2,4-diacetamido-2,4,6-trideoxy-beta-L-altropyranose hydrolase